MTRKAKIPWRNFVVEGNSGVAVALPVWMMSEIVEEVVLCAFPCVSSSVRSRSG